MIHGVFETAEHSIAEMSVEQFRRTIDVNLTGTFIFVKHFLRYILDPNWEPAPSVVIVGSTAGRFGEAGHADCMYLSEH
jgi:NAD(P)-dependent dehydrogenase (short-subunit alcohol dehydrogenase family)